MESYHYRMLFICTLIFVIFVQYGVALKCYICNSTQTTACGVMFDPKKTDQYIQECGQHIHEPVCRKEMHIPNGDAETPDHRQVVVQRMCSGHSPYKRHCYESVSAGHTLSVCECKDELCNGVNKKSTDLYFYLTSILIILFTKCIL